MDTGRAAAEATLSSSGREQKEPLEEDEGTEVIKNPVVLAVFDAILRFPAIFLCAVGVAFIVFASIASQYDHLKNKPLSLPMKEDRLTPVTKALQEDFRIMGNSAAPDTVVIYCDHCNLTTTPDFSSALRDINSSLAGVAGGEDCPYLTWETYTPSLPASRLGTFMSQDGSASVVLLHRNENLQLQQVSNCIRAVRPLLIDVNDKYSTLNIALGDTGSTAMVSADVEIRHVLFHLAISVPIFSGLLYMYVGSIYKALTPLMVLMCTIVFGRAMTVVIKWFYEDYNFSSGDTISMFVVVALSLDYGVIYWGRFRSECENSPSGTTVVQCVMGTLKSAGMVIMVSVAVLEVGFGGMYFYPDMNSSGNLSQLVTLTVDALSVGIHSLIIPSALATLFPSYYEERPSCCTGTVFTYIFGSSGLDESDRIDQRQDPIHQPKHPSLAHRFFRWYSKHATCAPWVYILPVLVYACMVPFLCQLGTFHPFFNILDCLLDKHLPEYDAYQVYKARFNTMRANPSMLLLKAERAESLLETTAAFTSGRPGYQRGLWASALQPDTVARSAGFLEPAHAQDALVPLTGEHRFVTASFLQNFTNQQLLPEFLTNLQPVSLSPEFRALSCRLAETIINGTRGTPYEVNSRDIETLWWDSVNGSCRTIPDIRMPMSRDGTEQLLTVYGRFDSLSTQAQHLTDYMWNEVEGLARTTFTAEGVKYRFGATYWSLVGVEMLSDEKLQKRAPFVIAFSVVLICAVVGCFFRSVGVSVKVSLSVVVPILCNYGILISIWQNGWFEWMGLLPVGGVLSFTMYTTFGFLLGLAIDYDIVLFARVYERRLMGYDNLSAVRMALVETGPLVTLAGTLMVAAFFVMCFDHLAFVRQMALLYFVGVGLDTYVVRTCIAPTMLVLAGRLNYWPSKMPPETKSWNP